MRFKKYADLVPYIFFIILGFLFFPSAGRDDVYITYWAAYALSNFGEIVNYNGDRIEQSSSMLYTLILALTNFITKANIVNIGTYVSIFFGLTTIYLTGKLSLIIKQERFIPQIIAASSVPLIYWSFGALETSLVAAVILFLLISTIKFSSDQTQKKYLLCVIAIFLYLTVRPEAIFVICLFQFIPLCLFFFRNERYSPFLILITTTIILFSAIVYIRYYYFGSFFPQPVQAKIGVSIFEKIYSGLRYYPKSVLQYPLFVLFALPIVLFITIRYRQTIINKDLVVIISLLLTYALFVLSSGGDWMEGARFFVPTLGPIIVLATTFYIPLFGKKNTVLYGVTLNIILLLHFTLVFSTGCPLLYFKDYSTEIPKVKEFSFFEITNRVHYRDIPFIIEFKSILEKITSKGLQPTVMSSQAGMVPYYIFQDYYKKIRFIDFRGLSTRDFTECPITNSLPKLKVGISMKYEYFFANINTLQKECNLVTPDVIYDLDNETLDRLDIIEASGYSLVYLQTGKISNNGFFKGGPVEGTQFIAVRNDIASSLGLKTEKFEFK